jgi:hypothetical protein
VLLLLLLQLLPVRGCVAAAARALFGFGGEGVRIYN